MSKKPKEDEDSVVVTCPECNAKVSLSTKEAEEKMLVRCPNGHEIPLVKAF
jgi:hypothetical protein